MSGNKDEIIEQYLGEHLKIEISVPPSGNESMDNGNRYLLRGIIESLKHDVEMLRKAPEFGRVITEAHLAFEKMKPY